jgi:hypothetical protein
VCDDCEFAKFKGKEEEARLILCSIRGTSDVEEELQEVKQKFEEERELSKQSGIPVWVLSVFPMNGHMDAVHILIRKDQLNLWLR